MGQIEGVQDALDILKQYPFDCERIIRKATKAAGNSMKRTIKKGMPNSTFRKAVKVKLKKGRMDMAIAGVFGEQRGSYIPVYFKVYWSNYGTLGGRDPQHQFKNKIRKTGAIPKGIRYQGFFERSVEAGWEACRQAFITTIDTETKQQQ